MTGGVSTFVLLRRQHGSLEVQVSSSGSEPFEKIKVLTNKEIIEQIIEPEQAELKSLINDSHDASRPHLELALTMNDDRIRDLENSEPANDRHHKSAKALMPFIFTSPSMGIQPFWID